MVYDPHLKTDLNEKLKQIDDYWFWNLNGMEISREHMGYSLFRTLILFGNSDCETFKQQSVLGKKAYCSIVLHEAWILCVLK